VSRTIRKYPGEFETCPDWGATKLVVILLNFGRYKGATASWIRTDVSVPSRPTDISRAATGP
jgi:hypothetical protein